MNAEHTDVAAYALGLLDPADREEFEAHLAQCPACSAELAEFASMADLFAGLDPVAAEAEEPDETAIVDLVTRRAFAQRRQRWQRTWLAAAACLVLLAIGVAAGTVVAQRPAAPPGVIQVTGIRHSATNPATGISGLVGLVSKPWGTQVTFDLSHVTGPLDCELIAVSKTGERRVMIGWLVPKAGYGVPDHPAHLIIEGGTSISRTQLSKIQIQVVGGPTLLTIPV